ncbi:MAG: hypothetical protein IJ784_04645 [Ruminiclostridium sp.]|nr:hypothetical protein [Ruminiclostridium sp.]
MLKFFYRLKRRGGAVLFAVIAIMSLLIAMAITAYFTARSSYQTVVSNYDFSQMYLSAISVSDMMIEAITQDTYVAKSGLTDVNKFDDLKKEVQKLKKTKGASLTGTSSNIYGKSGNAILAAAAEDPVEPGVLDAVEVEITHQDSKPDATDPGITIYIFEIKTTAYYRDNTITVTDMVLNKAGTSTGSSNATPFSTFFTATGQLLDGTSTQKDHTRVVTIKSHEISDNAYFENDYTVFPSDNNNDFYGGITATGSVYIDKFIPHIPAPTATSRHDWFVGGDFVVGKNGKDIDLNGNNLYVNKNLVLGGDGATIKAGDIYVMGDLYLCSGGTVNITGNLYVQGNIYYTASDEVKNEVDKVGKMSNTYIDLKNTENLNVSGAFKCNGTQYGVPKTNWVNTGVKDQWGNDIWAAVPTGEYEQKGAQNTGTWDPDSVTVPVSSIQANTSSDTYEEKVTDTSLDSAISSKGQTSVFDTYTADQKTLNNKLTINSSSLVEIVDAEGKGTGKFEGTFTDSKGNEAAYVYLDKSGNGSVTVNIKYNEDGYLLDLDANSFGISGNYNYNIGTESGKTMPIVLASNFTDSSNNKSFSWKGSNYGSENGNSNVQLVDNSGLSGSGLKSTSSAAFTSASGNVMFELGNYNKTSGDYVSYSPEVKSSTDEAGNSVQIVDYTKLKSNVDTVVYYTSQKELVGTKAQLDKINNQFQSESALKAMLKSGTSTPDTGYEDRIMLVSNKDNGVAVNGERKNNTLCGYIYAPNGIYSNSNTDGGNAPVFGGMIVSSYKTDLSYFVYCEPQPSVISQLLGSLSNYTPGGGNKTPADGYWVTSGVGKNYLG